MIFRILTTTFLLLIIVGCGSGEDSGPEFMPIESSVPMGENTAGSALIGTWYKSTPGNVDILTDQWMFFDDGTYIYLDHTGIEWGTFSHNESTGELTTTQTVDQSDTGLTTVVAQSGKAYFNASSANLNVIIDEGATGTTDIEADYQRLEPNVLIGTWKETSTESDLVLLTIFEAGLNVNFRALQIDVDGATEFEEGHISRNNFDGKTAFVTFNLQNIADLGMSRYPPSGPSQLFTELNGDILTFNIDEDSNESIDISRVFQRQ